jgi:hypothetical protein
VRLTLLGSQHVGEREELPELNVLPAPHFVSSSRERDLVELPVLK